MYLATLAALRLAAAAVRLAAAIVSYMQRYKYR